MGKYRKIQYNWMFQWGNILTDQHLEYSEINKDSQNIEISRTQIFFLKPAVRIINILKPAVRMIKMTCTQNIRVPVGVRCSMLFHPHPFIIFNIYIYIYICTSCENKTLVHHHKLFNSILMLFGSCISTEIFNVYSQISTIYKCIRYLCIYIYMYTSMRFLSSSCIE